MNSPIVFMFSGQGSQYYHMGKNLFNSCDDFRQCMLELDTLLSRYTGRSIVDEIYNPHKKVTDSFHDILYTHPAIFMVEYALCHTLLKMDIVPDYVLGASLGEFISAAVAHSMALEDVAECIAKQAILFTNYCDNGCMIAIIRDSSFYYENAVLYENSEMASINYSSHFVISAHNENLALITGFLKQNNVVYQVLPVSYGFHSSLIDAVETHCKSLFRTISYRKPELASVSCSLGDKVTDVSADFLWGVIRKPILFQQAISYIENHTKCVYVDVGPGGTLANFLKHSQAGKFVDRCYSIMTPFHQDLKYLKAIEGLSR